MASETVKAVTKTPCKEFWLVDQYGEGQRLLRGKDGVETMSGDSTPYEDCDFDLLTGLLVLEGTLWTKGDSVSTQNDDEDAPDYWPGGSYDWFYEATWRQGTPAEAIELGLVARTPPPADALSDAHRSWDALIERITPEEWEHHALMCGSPSVAHFKRETHRVWRAALAREEETDAKA